MKYIWSDLPGPATVPQLVVLTRMMAIADGVSDSLPGVRAIDEHVVQRATAAEAIRAFDVRAVTAAISREMDSANSNK
jgi:hypothetical protein